MSAQIPLCLGKKSSCISLRLWDSISSEGDNYLWFIVRTQSMAQAVQYANEGFITHEAYNNKVLLPVDWRKFLGLVFKWGHIEYEAGVLRNWQ
jgi:hypothetical protein